SSCVLKITSVDGRSALLTGDIEAAQEQALLQAAVDLSAQLLLVPHHGSKTSSSSAFIHAVQPQFAVVQSGYRNRFGHPAPQVVQRYQARAIPVINTPACGAALWRSWMPNSVQCERAIRRRYWSAVLVPD
ncbi:MAG: ComEC/Rec2 family competence protein, partial [Comamonas sp.]